MRNTGGPAFPVEIQPSERERARGDRSTVFTGLTIRDHFAGEALPSVMDSEFWRTFGYNPVSSMTLIENAAKVAYAIADAMLVERNKP